MNPSQFESELLPEELAEIARRRKTLEIDVEVTDKAYESDLVGVALSGGGIRSSTLALGVIQSLSKANILPRVDFLSTVSGGGFIGGCVSSTLNDASARSDAKSFPLRENIGERESNELTQLRNSGKYLAPAGFLEKLRIPALLVRGMLINLVLIFPLIVLAVMLTEFWAEYLGFGDEALLYIVRISTVAFFLLGLVPPYLSYLFVRKFNWKSRQRYEYFFIFFLVLALAALLLYPLTLLVEESIDISWGRLIYTTIDELSWATDSALFWVILLVAVSLLVLAGRASANLASLRNRLLLYLASFVGPGLIFILYALLCVWQIDSPYIHLHAGYNLPSRDIHDLEDGVMPETLMKRMANEDQPLDNPRKNIKVKPLDEGEGWQVSDGHHSYEVIQRRETVLVKNLWLVNALEQPLLQESVVHLLKLKNLDVDADIPVVKTKRGDWSFEDKGEKYSISKPRKEKLKLSPHPRDLLDRWDVFFYGGAFILFLLNFIFVNVNFTSLHGFYRDQLTRGFLFRSGLKTGSDSGRRVRLSELNTQGSAAPYHLVNVTMNLQGSDDVNLRGRGADFFVLSRHYCGSERTGYVKTKDMETVDPHQDLGTAIAISGAAASPNAGSLAIRPLVFIMTMLNLRLGYWAPNPAAIKASSAFGRFLLSRGAGPIYVFREALGALTAKTRYVNLSDGGHLENMGIYQLLRRRCKTIICSDGECDPELQCGGLVKLVRLAAIDLGVRIDIDLSPLHRKGVAGKSGAHFVVGEIDYGNGERGQLYYIKASLTGDENPYVHEYQQRNKDFPHESTAEQFFTEEQFEAYRALGSHMADQMIGTCDALSSLKHAPKSA
ncbi:MAG: hypothetical protein ABJL54_11660 [Halioglobus sp.]